MLTTTLGPVGSKTPGPQGNENKRSTESCVTGVDFFQHKHGWHFFSLQCGEWAIWVERQLAQEVDLWWRRINKTRPHLLSLELSKRALRPAPGDLQDAECSSALECRFMHHRLSQDDWHTLEKRPASGQSI